MDIYFADKIPHLCGLKKGEKYYLAKSVKSDFEEVVFMKETPRVVSMAINSRGIEFYYSSQNSTKTITTNLIPNYAGKIVAPSSIRIQNFPSSKEAYEKHLKRINFHKKLDQLDLENTIDEFIRVIEKCEKI
jgi:hypothetical protein